MMEGSSAKRPRMTRGAITLDTKVAILRKLDAGMRQVDIRDSEKIPTSTIRTILSNREKIMRSVQTTSSASSTKITRSRNTTIERMEKLLSIWIDDEAERNIPLSQAIIVQKAKSIFNHLQEETGDTEETFKGSNGWFKVRRNLHNVQLSGEGASADVEAASAFPATLKTIVQAEDYPPELVFNVDETGLYWKRMPRRTFLSREQKRAPGYKVAKDRFTLLLGGNATGDFKLKPLLIYHSENPRAMKGILKSSLPVIWTTSKKSWMTGNIFQDWFLNHCCPAVKRYCESKDLEPRALLLIDNAPRHPTHLSDLETCIPVKIIFLPPNTTSLIQPMDQGVISNFKAYYLRSTFRRLIEETDGRDKQSIREFWKSYTIMDAVRAVDKAWKEVSQNCMTGVWKNIWPDLHKESRAEETTVDVDELVQLGIETGLDNVNAEDIVELLSAASESLSLDEIKELSDQNQRPTIPVEEERPDLETEILEHSLTTIREVMDQLVEQDPDGGRSLKAKQGVLDAISCHRILSEERQRQKKQSTLDRFFTKRQDRPPE